MLHLILSLAFVLANAFAPVATQEQRQITVVNSFSFNTATSTVARTTHESFVTFYIFPKPTFLTGNFTFPGTTTLSDGFRIECDQCALSEDQTHKINVNLELLAVIDQGNYVQVNAYNNTTQVTRYVPDISGNAEVDYYIRPASGTPFVTATGSSVKTVRFGFYPLGGPTAPGVFSADNTGTGTIGGTHYNVVTQQYTQFTTCATTPSSCPVSTQGQQNFLILYTTGGKSLRCNPCANPADPPYANFRLTIVGSSPLVTHTMPQSFVGLQSTGLDQWNVPIPAAVQGNGTTYKIELVDTTGNPWNVSLQSNLTVRLGAAN